MRFVWLGFHAEGLPALEALIDAGAPIAAVLTLRPDLAVVRNGGADYAPLCERHAVPLHCVANINDPDALELLRELAPDVVFAIGWHQLIREEALGLARLGMIGAHASLLPHYRGSAPINWALIRGERRTGNTLFWMAEREDDGDIIDQTAFPITPYDTCATLYQRVAESNRDMLLRLFPKLLAGERPGTPRPPIEEPVLPRRRPADGCIDWDQPGRAVYNFVRALTHPYPGAFSSLEGDRWFVWKAALSPLSSGIAPSGTVLGAVVSPVEQACGQLVACRTGTITLLEVERDGMLLRGPALSEQIWSGKRWRDD